MKLDAKAVIAILVVLLSFGLVGSDLFLRPEHALDATIAAFSSGGLMLVLGFYFGAHNGAISYAASSAAASAAKAETLLALAQQRRHGDVAQ